MSRVKLAILISGRGSNMDALLQACEAADYPATPVLVLSNRADAGGLEIASTRSVPTCVIDHKPYGKDREAFEAELTKALGTSGAEIIALAGFMRILTDSFVRRWQGRLVNIHPSLLPKYPGLKTHARALEAGDTEAGASVHWVSEGVDEGEIILQGAVPIKNGDSPESLAARVLTLEHDLYPRGLAEACKVLCGK